MKSTTCEMPGWMNLEQAGITVARKNINNLRYTDDSTVVAESKERGAKEPLDEGEGGE